ncbi:hypothetical protein GGQ19_002757 [Salinibacter ruber]|uniref:hypothetical protein n=1 Tax=Salinibacter ruber TaxID=146919 RepID=UPI00216872B5|nr:hypothetical protein [Salinibacter ruber]MCS3751562.1 hypothetical protein [Salinibacter ruber]
MVDSTLPILGRLLGAVLIVGGPALWGGCDTVPAPERTQRGPSVADLQVTPDSVHGSDLDDEQIVDSLAQVAVDVSARVADPDGTVERVVFVFEPSSNPRRTISGALSAVEPPVYGGTLPLSVPLVDEVYTVRVFAVDDDSLSGNQVTGQFRFVPTDTSGAGGGENALRMQLHRRPDDS